MCTNSPAWRDPIQPDSTLILPHTLLRVGDVGSGSGGAHFGGKKDLPEAFRFGDNWFLAWIINRPPHTPAKLHAFGDDSNKSSISECSQLDIKN